MAYYPLYSKKIELARCYLKEQNRQVFFYFYEQNFSKFSKISRFRKKRILLILRNRACSLNNLVLFKRTTPSGLWTEEWTERKNVRFISVHAVHLKKIFSASSLMFIAFSAMSRHFFVGLLGRSLQGRTVHLILHRDSKDGYASLTRKDPPARTSPHLRTRS